MSGRTETIVLETASCRLGFEAGTGRLVSFHPKAAPKQEFLACAPGQPAFVIQYLDPQRQYRQLDSLAAGETRIACADSAAGKTLTMSFGRVGGVDLDVTITVRAAKTEPLSRWNLALRNGAGLEIVSVEFPFVVASYQPAGKPSGEAVLLPRFAGSLVKNPRPDMLGPDHPRAWRLAPENGTTCHYPGSVFAQFLAYYNDQAGVYLACEDAAANVKLINAVHRDDGLRLGIAHVGDWPVSGQRTLEYDVVLGAFTGDWHAAAEIYRRWALRQKWATPLHRRQDIPAWLLDSPVHITLRMQGELDAGPVFPVKEFLPYEKTIPLLERIARRVQAPLAVILMSWERGGPWVYPDCFPPVGGDESITRFTTLARRRDWHVGSFCNGTRWVVGHFWNRYDGWEHFRRHEGEKSVCRLPDGQSWQERWDQDWRPSFACCMGAEKTRQIAADFVKRLIGWGMESVQFFDQNINAATFPCFATDHGHPATPGKWLVGALEQTVELFHQVARDAGQGGVIQSVEMPCNEHCLPLFQQCDVRVTPPNDFQGNFVPVYHYLYHECIILHGMMSYGFEPYALPMRNAYNLVLGEILGAVMTGDGELLNKETWNWACWEPKVGSNDDALEMLRTGTALRRGPGRGFLVYGRMLAPATVGGIERVDLGKERKIDAVFHAAWQAPDGRTAVVLANWTTKTRKVILRDARLGKSVTVHVSGRALKSREMAVKGARLTLTLPPLSCVLIESKV